MISVQRLCYLGTNYIRANSFDYNLNGQRKSLTDARGYRAEMTYDPNGNRVQLRKRDGRVLGYEHDALNRVVIKYSPDGAVRYAYDLRGLQTAAWFTGTGWYVANNYDGFGRLVSTTSSMGGFTRTVSHRYDRDGRDSELGFPDGEKFRTARDGLGRTGAVYQGPLGSTSTWRVAFAYNWASQLYYFARRSGDSSACGHDGPGRLSVIEDGFGGGTGNTRSDFLYNPAGRLRSETRGNDDYQRARRHRNCVFSHRVGPILRAAAELGSRRRDGRISAREEI